MTRIEDEIGKVDWKNQEQVINFYESNKLYFDNSLLISDEEKISQIIDIMLHYANAHFNKSQYDKVLGSLELLDKLLKNLDQNHWNYKKSEEYVRYLKGMVLGHKKMFKESHSIFTKLIHDNPDHHYYKIWYNHTKVGLYNWIFNTISFVGLGMVIIDLVFDLADILPINFGLVGLVMVVSSYLLQQGSTQYFKRKHVALGSQK